MSFHPCSHSKTFVSPSDLSSSLPLFVPPPIMLSSLSIYCPSLHPFVLPSIRLPFHPSSHPSFCPAPRHLCHKQVFGVIPDPACAPWDPPRSQLQEDLEALEDGEVLFGRLRRRPGADRGMTLEAWMAHWQMVCMLCVVYLSAQGYIANTRKLFGGESGGGLLCKRGEREIPFAVELVGWFVGWLVCRMVG